MANKLAAIEDLRKMAIEKEDMAGKRYKDSQGKILKGGK